jgi:ABC-type oligopeptide transport system substrate-binding subunit
MPLPAGPGAPAGATAVSRPMHHPTPDDFLQPLLETGGSENVSGYANAAFDAQVAGAPAVADPGLRAERYQQAERLALGTLPVIPLFWQRSFRMVRAKGWKGLGMDTFGNPTLRTLAPK